MPKCIDCGMWLSDTEAAYEHRAECRPPQTEETKLKCGCIEIRIPVMAGAGTVMQYFYCDEHRA